MNLKQNDIILAVYSKDICDNVKFIDRVQKLQSSMVWAGCPQQLGRNFVPQVVKILLLRVPRILAGVSQKSPYKQ